MDVAEGIKGPRAGKKELEENVLGLPRFFTQQVNEPFSMKLEMPFSPLVVLGSHGRHDGANIYSSILIKIE